MNGSGGVVPTMGDEQRHFFRHEFRPAFLAGDPLEVGDESGYVAAMLVDLARRWPEDESAPESIRRLAKTYEGRGGLVFSRFVIADTHFLEGDFQAGYDAVGDRKPLRWALSLGRALGHPRLSALTVFWWSENHITSKGLAGFEPILDSLQRDLDEFHAARGVSAVVDFWQRLIDAESVEEVATAIEDEVIERFSGPEVRMLLEDVRKSPGIGEAPAAFEGYPDAATTIDWPAPWVQHGSGTALVFAKVRQMMRAAENEYRANSGLPLVGQGWVSEMVLFRELKSAFPGERVVHQGRPLWLGAQSVDIFFPDKGVGVEYQGAQHVKPVEYFGGADAFERQQERDFRKRGLFNENGCTLIEVHPGYNLGTVIRQVSLAISAHDARTADAPS